MRFTFGPVPSRRLGLSLGIDMVPYKTCSFDCVYCQLGRTNCKTSQRRAFADIDELIADLRVTLPQAKADYVTLSGSGEPTLSIHVGRVIREVKELTAIPVAVITNGSLLTRADLRNELLDADLVIPSLDAASREVFEKINRPCSGLDIGSIIDGLERFSMNYSGKVWVEVMVVKEINDGARELDRISRALSRVRAERIQLNTVERPPAEAWACSLTVDDMERVKGHFDSRAELIAASHTHSDVDERALDDAAEDEAEPLTAKYESVIELLRRRPCTVFDVANGLGITPNEASKLVGSLKSKGLICASCHSDRKTYFFAQ